MAKRIGVGDVVVIVLEYSPSQRRVITRGVWPDNGTKIPLLSPENTQNYVKHFFGVEKQSPGFSGLVIDDDQGLPGQ